MAVLGFDQQGASNTTQAPTDIIASRVVATESGSVQSISVLLQRVITSGNVTLGIYADADGAPGALLGQSAGASFGETSPTWHTQNLTSPVAITQGAAYWLATSTSLAMRYFFDDAVDGASLNIAVQSYSHGNQPDPFPEGTETSGRQRSSYATYTPAAAGAPAGGTLRGMMRGMRIGMK